MIDELTFRDWAGCVVSDDPEIHALAGEVTVEPQTLGWWLSDMGRKLEDLAWLVEMELAKTGE